MEWLEINDEYLQRGHCIEKPVHFNHIINTRISGSNKSRKTLKFKAFECSPTRLIKEAFFLTDGYNSETTSSLYLLHRKRDHKQLHVIAEISLTGDERNGFKKFKNVKV